MFQPCSLSYPRNTFEYYTISMIFAPKAIIWLLQCCQVLCDIKNTVKIIYPRHYRPNDQSRGKPELKVSMDLEIQILTYLNNPWLKQIYRKTKKLTV